MYKKGFTLLELMVVVSIVGLLAGSFVVSSGNTRKKSRDDKRKADLLAIQSALELYFAQNKRYPTNCPSALLDGVNSAGPPTGYSAGSVVWPSIGKWINHARKFGLNCLVAGSPQFTTTYLSSVPSDPTNSGAFIYRYKTNNDTLATSYELDAKLELDTTAMANDNGNCPLRYELFNLDGVTWLTSCP